MNIALRLLLSIAVYFISWGITVIVLGFAEDNSRAGPLIVHFDSGIPPYVGSFFAVAFAIKSSKINPIMYSTLFAMLMITFSIIDGNKDGNFINICEAVFGTAGSFSPVIFSHLYEKSKRTV